MGIVERAGFAPGVALDNDNERRHRREMAGVTNRMNKGGLNNVIALTLDAGTTTTIVDERVHSGSVLLLDPMGGAAATALAGGGVYITAANRTRGQFVITHGAGDTGLNFRVAILG